jgi:hypothetical protein
VVQLGFELIRRNHVDIGTEQFREFSVEGVEFDESDVGVEVDEEVDVTASVFVSSGHASEEAHVVGSVLSSDSQDVESATGETTGDGCVRQFGRR